MLALPLRNPTVLAKEVATLDFLSGGRSLPAVGLGTGDEREYEACGVPKRQRGGRTDEAIEVMRLLWSAGRCLFRGRYFTLNNVTVHPKPVQAELAPDLDRWPQRVRHKAYRQNRRRLAGVAGYSRGGG